ncbi:MAG: DMT family transporter [Rhodospirillales bacterium]|nr:DMT family transporter [Rhodospirillales bacterium]MBO6786376.1 DMT family transporter [Rhodospirillales bacterium]
MQTPPPAQAGDTRAGIFWMIMTMLMFVSMDTCAKYLVSHYPTMQAVWGRYFFQVVILCVALAPRIPELMRTQSLTFQLVRSLFLLGATLCFFTGLGTIQVAEASAIMFTAPLMLTAAAPFVLKEKVGVRRWVSVIIGFIGAMIIIRPGQGALAEGAFWVLGAAACYACYQLSTRALSGQDSVLTTLFYSALLGALIMSAVVPFHFVMFAPIDWAIMALAGLFGTVGHFCMIKAFTNAEASQVAPYSYTNLIWASIIGFVLFGTLPDIWTYAGAGIIIASGLYIIHRERKTRVTS